MDAPRPGLDLEKELSCSICTEVLYQPLTLLDCLHTFCGSCLKDWFGWQANAAENSPNPPASGSQIASCPSCRASVRGTRHNATVATLLEMFISANPEKDRLVGEKEEMQRKYKHGDNVLPRIRSQETSPEERGIEEMERQMLERAREMSLRDAGSGSSSSSQVRHRREHRAHSRDERSRSGGDSGRESRHRNTRDPIHRQARDEERRRRTASNGILQTDGSSSDEGRRRRSASQQTSRDSSRNRRRAIEHQASIRSLISSSDVDSRDIEREIEEFARQITEEGLLDGLDVDNIDLSRNDDLTRKITEAYRRRQNQRSQHESTRRRDASTHSRHSEIVSVLPRPPLTDSSRSNSRQRNSSVHTRSFSSASQVDDRRRPPVTSTHLQVRSGPQQRQRRRTSSGGRSATDATRPSTPEVRPAARSQTDLSLRSGSADAMAKLPSFAESRSSSMPTATSSTLHGSIRATFSERASAAQVVASPPPEIAATVSDVSSSERTKRRPANLNVYLTAGLMPSLGLPLSPGRQQRARSHFYQEPSITCSRCQKQHIEYELHYNCSTCAGGDWNICVNCYRTGQGCLHWFGFGYAAFTKWRQRANGNEHFEPPHMLTSNRYNPPKTTPGGADGRRTMTTDNPKNRLESGMFCARCFSWANECFWRCKTCNEGDWGFCNNCVNQGRSCTHELLPLTYVSPKANSQTSPTSPRMPNPPAAASIFTGPNALNIGNFRPLTFTTICDICRTAIPPSHNRYHCYSCTSTVVPDTHPGDYDICTGCYINLVDDGHMAKENGHTGWRRCLKGHRMVQLVFRNGNGGQKRRIDQDLVGGWDLHMDLPGAESEEKALDFQKWWWYGPDRVKLERLVTEDVASSAPAGPEWTDSFPPDGGVGMSGKTLWSWYPQAGADDELLFPKGAEIREIEDVNGDWFFGVYMGAKGLFPALYVRIPE